MYTIKLYNPQDIKHQDIHDPEQFSISFSSEFLKKIKEHGITAGDGERCVFPVPLEKQSYMIRKISLIEPRKIPESNSVTHNLQRTDWVLFNKILNEMLDDINACALVKSGNRYIVREGMEYKT